MLFNQEKLSNFIKKNYSNIGQIISVRQFHFQKNSETYEVITKKGHFVLHHNNFDNKLRTEKMCLLLNKISKQNSKIICPLKTRENTFSKNNWYLTKFEDGKIFSGKRKEFFNLSKNLLLLHKNLKNISNDYNFRPNHKNYKLLESDEILKIKKKLFKNKLTKHEKIVKQNFSIIEFEIKKSMAFQKKILSKKQVIHFDLHPGNILFKNSNVKLFLDFNSMRIGYPIEDVMFSSFRFAYVISKNPKKIHFMIFSFLNEYYNNNIPFENSELKLILIRNILYRICFILRNHFFNFSDYWISDLEKQIEYLKLIKKIF